jgi:CheY-like chemotaxis protein
LNLLPDSGAKLSEEISMARNFLLVDDSRVARMVLKRTILELEPDSTFEEAGDGEQALNILSEGEFDLAFLDFHMPGMTGLELLEEIRKSNQELKIIMLTANIQHEIKERAAEMNSAFIEKPVNKDKLESLL